MSTIDPTLLNETSLGAWERYLSLRNQARTTATTPEGYREALFQAAEGLTDEEFGAVEAKIQADLKSTDAAFAEYARGRESFEFHYGSLDRAIETYRKAPDTLSDDVRGIVAELADPSEFLRAYQGGDLTPQDSGLKPDEIAAQKTSLGRSRALDNLSRERMEGIRSQVGVTPMDVMLDALEDRLPRASRDLQKRAKNDPDLRDQLARYTRASEIYTRMGASRDEKAQELVADGTAGSFREGQDLITAWLEDAHGTLSESRQAIESRYGKLLGRRDPRRGGHRPSPFALPPAPGEVRDGFLGFLDDLVRGPVKTVAPVLGEEVEAAINITTPRSDPFGFNVQTVTEEFASLLTIVPLQFGAVGGIATKAGQVGGKVAGKAGEFIAREATRFGAAEAISPRIPLEDVETRAKATAVAAAAGPVLTKAGQLAVKGGKVLVGKLKPKAKPVVPPTDVAKPAPKVGKPLKPLSGVELSDARRKLLEAERKKIIGGPDLGSRRDLDFKQKARIAEIDKLLKAPSKLAAPVKPPKSPEQATLGQLSEAVGPQAKAQDRLLRDVELAKPLQTAQAKITKAERARRFADVKQIQETTIGEEGLIKELGALKGTHPKVQFEPVAQNYSRAERTAIYEHIKASKLLSTIEKVRARTIVRDKLLNPDGVFALQPNEANLLGRVYGSKFVEMIQKKFGGAEELSKFTQLGGIMRTLKASGELSATLRQGVWMAARHPVLFYRAAKAQIGFLRNNKNYVAMQEEIVARPNYELMRDADLALTALSRGARNSAREEEFVLSNLVERLAQKPGKLGTPGRLVGRFVAATQRAHTGFLTKLRADVFDETYNRLQMAGHPMNRKQVSDLAKFINNWTGRGDLGRMEKHMNTFATVFFSPRFQASRMRILSPVTYVKMDKEIRKEALAATFSTVAAGLGVLELAWLAGAKVERNPKNSDFGKVKVGNTRVDIWGGAVQYPTLIARLITGEKIKATTGERVSADRFMTTLNFMTSRFAPLLSVIKSFLKGKDWNGDPINTPGFVARQFIPIFVEDIIDLAKEDPRLLPLIAPAALGVSIQTFPTADRPLQDLENLSKGEGASKVLKANVKILNRRLEAAEAIPESGRTVFEKTRNFEKRKAAIEAVTRDAQKLLSRERKARSRKDVKGVSARFKTQEEIVKEIVKDAIRFYEEKTE